MLESEQERRKKQAAQQHKALQPQLERAQGGEAVHAAFDVLQLEYTCSANMARCASITGRRSVRLVPPSLHAGAAGPVMPDRGALVLQAAARAVLAAAVKPEEREVALNVTGEEAFARRARLDRDRGDYRQPLQAHGAAVHRLVQGSAPTAA